MYTEYFMGVEFSTKLGRWSRFGILGIFHIYYKDEKFRELGRGVEY